MTPTELAQANAEDLDALLHPEPIPDRQRGILRVIPTWPRDTLPILLERHAEHDWLEYLDFLARTRAEAV